MKTLDEIALTTNTDKSTAFHAYTPVYADLFGALRQTPVRLLEIGILGGDSLEMWARYFDHPLSTFVGVDIHDRGYAPTDKRISCVYCDAGQPENLKRLGGPFNIVIEDGSHFTSHQITAFQELWPMLAPGGIFCMEDLHVVHSQQHNDCHITILSFFNRIMHEMQDERGATGSAAPNPNDQWHAIESITVRKGMLIIRKRP